MLERCHGRMRDESEALCVALGRGAPAEEVEDALGFFERQRVRHERDEEESLFPRLRGRGEDGLLDELTRQHREHERLCSELRAGIERGAWAALRPLAEELRDSYRAHIQLE